MTHVVKNSTILTQYDITNLLRRFGGKNQQYVEIVDVQKNLQTINKYPLIKDVSSSVHTHALSQSRTKSN
ncbi:hypothetical protein CWB85_11320 [Pseudoalteromonas sp. S1727]|uniref:BcsR/BcsP family cellulose biosynthesis protein n=1 Tax=Pseudoalteromonas sp. S1727 TaxID=2066514 RepID=UPI001107B308|nr:BcsR/BcsP family cellulose biosynthesis protein [Pseudoalteromonas sp. S1727]TMN71388.1 hypothetical protein CWB85_11320 [Pseudoalteromonas sp. S1727]